MMYAEQKWKVFLGFMYIIVGVYVLNMAFIFVNIPPAITNLNKWILLVAAILIVFAGFKNFGRSYY